MARLFTAIELSPAVRAAIEKRQGVLAAAVQRAGDSGLRLVAPGSLHLTLTFMGDVPEDRVEVVAAALGRPIDVPPFTLDLGTTGVFPLHGPPRVLWIGVVGGATALARVCESVALRLEELGIARERRPFRPHLTVGRWRDRHGAGTIRRVLPASADVQASQQVEEVTLFRSRLGAGGAVHTPIARARLT